MASLQDLFVSKVRVKLLKIFLTNPQEIFYVRQLVRLSGEEINAVRRELQRMEERGMVAKEERGNRLYYHFQRDYLFYSELLRLVAKTTGLGQAMIRHRNKLGKIKYAFLSVKLVRKRPHKEDDVDLLVVGDIVMPQLAALVSQFEAELKREVNYSAMTKDEFDFRKKRQDPFILKVLSQSRLMLVGDEEEMID
ncbi:hypothetical protein A2160_00325 [Candidatus Beckwithbacteria bacterium RBG_13_42_9]|uniref:HTH arsR-type domain-containing protein n=1 Tax=Candidatus Beckwithbacteria bacterium RBG_13_42_9 TaxID=1797457 RepID=A0A1F5E534_9BACT|nr:MAG: hypothetical protein A2160_00325 [Candidatus Beckwithbacteria bacterium RBG_13_42_9]